MQRGQIAVGKGNIVIVEMGAGTAIPSVRTFSLGIGRDFGARIVGLNSRESQVPGKLDVGMATGSLEALLARNAVPEGATQGHDAGLECAFKATTPRGKYKSGCSTRNFPVQCRT